MIEKFFEAHQHTIAALAAGGTLAAVVTAIVLAFLRSRADRTKLTATADLYAIYDATIIDPESAPKFLKVIIRNHGKLPLRIQAPFFGWKLPFRGEAMMIIPLDLLGSSPLTPRKHYPTEITPRTSETFTLHDLATFKQEAKRMRGAPTFARRIRFRFIRAFVVTDDGAKFWVRIMPSVRRVWSANT
jgi:hypothetical protein